MNPLSLSWSLFKSRGVLLLHVSGPHGLSPLLYMLSLINWFISTNIIPHPLPDSSAIVFILGFRLPSKPCFYWDALHPFSETFLQLLYGIGVYGCSNLDQSHTWLPHEWIKIPSLLPPRPRIKDSMLKEKPIV